MKRTEIESTGVSGINVMLTNVELVALKSFVVKLKALSSSKFDYSREAKPLIGSMIVFLNQIVPKDTISIEEAYDELFTLPVDPVVVEPANNEL